MIKNIDNKNLKQKGQTLLFVVVAVTIALSVGVAVSTRTINSLRRVTRTDTSTRAIAAAEGGIENLLGRTYLELDAAKSPSDSNCQSIGALYDGTGCYYPFSGESSVGDSPVCSEYYCTCGICLPNDGPIPMVNGVSTNQDPQFMAATDPTDPRDPTLEWGCPVGSSKYTFQVDCDTYNPNSCIAFYTSDVCQTYTQTNSPVGMASDGVSSRAVVKVETFNSNEDDGVSYSFNLQPGNVKEIVLWNSDSDKYVFDTIQICFQEKTDSEDESAIYYYSYDKDGNVKKGGLYPNNFNYINGISTTSSMFQEASLSGGYYCKIVDLVNTTSYGLRIKVLYNDADVRVTPISGNLPTQGYKLTSKGEVGGSASDEKATVIVHKSYPYTPDVFDYGIYTPLDL